jgi:SAM-dependent methyltransferase
MSERPAPAERVVLNAGCGRMAENEKRAGAAAGVRRVYLDLRDNVGADVVHDLNVRPLPFANAAFDEIVLFHILEHIREIYPFMDEIHRIGKPGCRVRVVVPHYTDWTFWRDPGHVTHFNSFSFDRFEVTRGHHFDTQRPFKIARMRIALQKLWRTVGLEALVNLSLRVPALRFVRKFWETHLCFLVRGVTVEVDLIVVK